MLLLVEDDVGRGDDSATFLRFFSTSTLLSFEADLVFALARRLGGGGDCCLVVPSAVSGKAIDAAQAAASCKVWAAVDIC